jgi:hypothetical protein
VGHLFPAPDGKAIYSSVGVFTPDLQPLDFSLDQRFNDSIAYLPSYSSAFYLGLTNGSSSRRFSGGFGSQNNKATDLSLYSAFDRRMIMKLATLDEVGDPMSGVRTNDRLPADKRIFFIPQYNVLVTLALSRDRLILRAINLLQDLQKLDVDYLFVQSVPPAVATKGKPYTYWIEAVSRYPVTVKIESGPLGMTIDEKGLLQWTPSANYIGEEETIVLSLRDQVGQQRYHTFRIKVRDAF